jgi:hypothetical protein
MLPADTRLFNIPRQLVKTLNRDLLLAGIPKRDERGRTVDVHAMRTTFGTLLSKGGVPLRTAQAAMRHSDPSLTANVYTDPRLLDVHAALDSLPGLPLDAKRRPDIEAATGTDGRGADVASATEKRHSALAPTLAPTTFNSRAPQTLPVTWTGDTKANPNRAAPDTTSCHVATKNR